MPPEEALRQIRLFLWRHGNPLLTDAFELLLKNTYTRLALFERYGSCQNYLECGGMCGEPNTTEHDHICIGEGNGCTGPDSG